MNFDVDITSRPFLRSLIAAACSPFVAGCSTLLPGPQPLPDCFKLLLEDRGLLFEMAERARLKLSWDAEPGRAEALLKTVRAAASSDGCKVLRELSLSDYRAGRIVELEGWLFTETTLSLMLLLPRTLFDDVD